VRRTAKRIGKRAMAPLLAALDQRLRDLAVRLERHTASLAADQGRRLDQIDERVRIDLRVVDEHLLAITRAARAPMSEPDVPVPLDGGTGLVLIAHPGSSLALPAGYRIAEMRSYTLHADDGWRPVEAAERNDTLRIARLEPS
jgi:hypothetical protein